jgi:hypothetical protein
VPARLAGVGGVPARDVGHGALGHVEADAGADDEGRGLDDALGAGAAVAAGGDALAVRGLVDEDAQLGVGLELAGDDDRAALEVADAAGTRRQRFAGDGPAVRGERVLEADELAAEGAAGDRRVGELERELRSSWPRFDLTSPLASTVRPRVRQSSGRSTGRSASRDFRGA